MKQIPNQQLFRAVEIIRPAPNGPSHMLIYAQGRIVAFLWPNGRVEKLETNGLWP